MRGEPLPHKGFVTLYTDITEQRYIENLSEHQNIQLEERVRRRTAQLENANANLTRANSENSRITAALRRSEERLRLINDTIPILIGYVKRMRSTSTPTRAIPTGMAILKVLLPDAPYGT